MNFKQALRSSVIRWALLFLMILFFSMMNAMVLEGVHTPLLLKQVAKPELSAGEALIKIQAAALNRRDYWIQQGLYAGLRFPIILGSDGAGIVEQVATAQDAHWVGQTVMINPAFNWGAHEAAQSGDFQILGLPQNGTFAEYVKVPVQNLHVVPSHLTIEEAAAVPLGGVTAWRALFSRANLQKGDKVLIAGIGGGVATFALQWAIHAGAEVYVTSSKEEKIKKALDIGARAGVRYTDKNWSDQLTTVGGFDVIIDSAIGPDFNAYIDLAKPGGRIVFFGATASGEFPPLNARKIFWKQLSILGSTMGSPSDFAKMLAFLEEHQIKPIIDTIYPLAHAEEAIRKMDESVQFGKIVLKIA